MNRIEKLGMEENFPKTFPCPKKNEEGKEEEEVGMEAKINGGGRRFWAHWFFNASIIHSFMGSQFEGQSGEVRMEEEQQAQQRYIGQWFPIYAAYIWFIP